MKKTLARLVGFWLALPLRLRYAVLRGLVGRDAALSAISEHAAARPGLLGIYTRQALYRRLLSHTGSDIHFGYQTLFSKPAARLGDRVYLGRFCTVGWVEIANDAKIADGVQLLSGAHHHGSAQHGVEHATFAQHPIRIGEGAWIGANAVVMADIGADAIVGAGAVVTRPVAAGAVVGGVPARPIGSTKSDDAADQPRRAA